MQVFAGAALRSLDGAQRNPGRLLKLLILFAPASAQPDYAAFHPDYTWSFPDSCTIWERNPGDRVPRCPIPIDAQPQPYPRSTPVRGDGFLWQLFLFPDLVMFRASDQLLLRYRDSNVLDNWNRCQQQQQPAPVPPLA